MDTESNHVEGRYDALRYYLDGRIEEMFQSLQLHPIQIAMPDSSGLTLMHYVVRQGDVRLMKVLLEKKAPVDIWDRESKTPFFHAFEMMVKYGKEILEGSNSSDIQKKYNDATSIFTLLQQAGAKPEKFYFGLSAYQITDPVFTTFQKWFKGCDINVQDSNGFQPIHYASGKGNAPYLQWLLDQPQLCLTDNSRHVAHLWFSLATVRGVGVFSGFLQKSTSLTHRITNPNIVNDQGKTVLHIAAIHNNLDYVCSLRAQDVLPNAEIQDKQGNTALEYASSEEMHQLIEQFSPENQLCQQLSQFGFGNG